MSGSFQTILIGMLALWTPVWCCTVPASAAQQPDPTVHASASPSGERSTEADTCGMGLNGSKKGECDEGEGEPPSCPCDLMTDMATLLQKALDRAVHAAAIIPTPTFASVLPFDPAGPRLLRGPPLETMAAHPLLEPRAVLARLCVLTL